VLKAVKIFNKEIALMQPQQAPLIFAESERPIGERLLKLALETDRIEGYTEPHAVMIARLAEIIGRQLGLHGLDLSALKFAALAHDLGERAMKRNYLLSPSELNWEETLDLWRHPVIGEQAAAELRLSRQAQLLVRWHHEWWNGLGYPDGLSGTAIPLGSRILRAVDSYCSLISRRPYRQAYELMDAEQVIADLAGIEFDPQVVRLLLNVVVEERKQREAETWSAESEPDLQYVSPVEDSYEPNVETASYAYDSAPDEPAEEFIQEIQPEIVSAQSPEQFGQSSEQFGKIVETAPESPDLISNTTDAAETAALPEPVPAVAETSPIDDSRLAELEIAPTAELVPQEQAGDDLQPEMPIAADDQETVAPAEPVTKDQS